MAAPTGGAGALVPSVRTEGVKRTLQFAIEEEESAQVRKWYVVSPRQVRPSNQVAICLFLAGVVQNLGCLFNRSAHSAGPGVRLFCRLFV